MRRLVTVFCLLGTAAPAAALPIPSDHACMGPWVGRGRNSGFSTYWTIDLTLTSGPSGARCGTIEYTNPVCGGTLERCELVGQDIHTVESYSHDDGDCAPPGRVIIRCEGDQMRYSWIGWERVDTILHRPEGWTPPPSTAPAQEPPAPSPGPPPSGAGATPVPSDTPAPSPATPPRDGSTCALGCAAGGTRAVPLAGLVPVATLALRRRRRALGARRP